MGASQPKSPSFLVQVLRTFVVAARLFVDSRVPLWAKVIPVAVLLYVIFPFDFIPDFIPGLGQLDDLTVLLLGLWAFMQFCPPNVVHEYTTGSKVVDGSYHVVEDQEPAPPRQPEQIWSPDQPKKNY